jgi:palmitoyltransferase ZDHHC9/14/18
LTPLLWGSKKASGYRKLLCMVGPFWPVLIFVTYPLIFVISGAVAFFCLPHIHIAFSIITVIGFAVVVVSLGLTAFVDPGMVITTKEKPGPGWSYSDQAKTFRPKHAFYCNMCKVCIQEYDHTCPWTGTGIGKHNFTAFKVFAGSVTIFFWYLLGVVAITVYSTNKEN